MKRLDIVTATAGVLGLISVGLASQGGLALVVAPVSGEKHCMDRLAAFLGVPSGGAAVNLALLLSELWIGFIPLALLGAAAMLIRRRKGLAR